MERPRDTRNGPLGFDRHAPSPPPLDLICRGFVYSEPFSGHLARKCLRGKERNQKVRCHWPWRLERGGGRPSALRSEASIETLSWLPDPGVSFSEGKEGRKEENKNTIEYIDEFEARVLTVGVAMGCKKRRSSGPLPIAPSCADRKHAAIDSELL